MPRTPATARRPDWADTLPIHRPADAAGYAASPLVSLLRKGRTQDAACLMRQRGISVSTAIDMVRVFGPRYPQRTSRRSAIPTDREDHAVTPHQLQPLQLQQSARRLLRRWCHATRVHRHMAALQHHQDQISQLCGHYAAIEAAQAWHARQAAVAPANLRALGAIQPDGSIRNAAAPSWACPRIGGVAILISAGIVAAAVWHLAAWWLQ